MGRKTGEPHSFMTAGYGEATEATGLPGVTALVRRWSGPPYPGVLKIRLPYARGFPPILFRFLTCSCP